MSRKTIIEKKFPKAVLQALVGLWGRVPEGYEVVSNIAVPPDSPYMNDYYLTFKHEGRVWSVDYSVAKQGGTYAFKHEGDLVTCYEVATTEHGEVFSSTGAPVHVTNAGAVARSAAESKDVHEWPARAKSFGTTARLGSMSSAAQAEDEAHPYGAYAGFNDPDSGLETEPAAPHDFHAWPAPRAPRLAGGMGDLSNEFRAEDRRAPRNRDAVNAYWNTYQAAIDCGFSDREACVLGDKAAATVRAAVAAAA